MNKKAIYVEVGEVTEKQIEDLRRLYGSLTQVITVAVDRMWQLEVKIRKQKVKEQDG